MLKVTTMGGETLEVEYQQGMLVKDVLKSVKADEEATKKATISVNGEDADLETMVEDGSLVIVTPKVGNG